MVPDAALYLFTYGRRCSVPVEVLERLGLAAEYFGTALLNLPPASVYRIGRLRDIR
jgi:phospholipid N-methyltransferase